MILILLFRTATAKLTDYSNSDYIPLQDGDVTVWQNFDYLQHTTNLTTYMEIAKETKGLMTHFPLSHMKMLLDSDIARIKVLLATLDTHHRQARSLNFLGTALKVIAGTPDFDDFEKVKFQQQELINSENRQIAINTEVQEKINQLTETVNLIIKNSNTKQIDTSYLYKTLLARNRIIISEIETLISAITLAKIGVINPLILSTDDARNIIDMRSTNTTITDLMEVSFIKVLLDSNFLHFIIKYPKPTLVCKKIILFPVQHKGTILHFANDDIIADCSNQILAIGNCSVTLTSTFCRKLPHPTCAQQLHSGSVAHCSTRPSRLEPVVVVDEGIVIINDNTVVIKTSEDPEKTVTGTYLLTFENEVQINGSNFKNHNGMLKKLPSSATTALLNITSHHEILSMPYLRRLSIKNLRYIGEIGL